MSQGLDGVRKAARERKQERFTALLHHLSVDLLRDSFHALKRGASPGVDGMTWQEYETGLEDRLVDLHSRVHRGAYRAQPSRRVYIPKADGRQRPLGIASLEDKIVQQAVVTILNQIYEVDFKGFSYGFRPGRSPHQALDALSVGITRKKVNWMLDADIRGFFDNLSHDWAVKFIEHRVADRRIIRLIQKWLQAGVSEDGQWSETSKGTPQGAVVSPLIANVYLHYCFDLWADVWRRKVATGDVIIVRYADDLALGFQYRADAVRFLEDLKERFAKFGLELRQEKTRLIEFGRYAAKDRQQRGAGKPETFNFLGFTYFCGRRLKTDTFTVGRITSEEADGCEAEGHQGRTSPPDACSPMRGRCMASEGRQRLLPIPRSARKSAKAGHLQAAYQSVVVPGSREPQPTRPQKVGDSHSVI
jgi:group II intron reverse transcriptase/maturase